MTEPIGDGSFTLRLAAVATTLLGIFMLLTAIVGALAILLMLTRSGEAGMIGQLILLLLGPYLVLAFTTGLMYRRAGRDAYAAGMWTTGMWRTGLASLVIAAAMALTLRYRIDPFWDEIAVHLTPLRHVMLCVLALHGLFVGILGYPRNAQAQGPQ